MSDHRRRDGDDAEVDGGARWVMQVVALYDYDPEEHDELAFQEGDVIRVVHVQGDGWWRGFAVHAPRRLGVFPSNYVQVQQRRPPAGQSGDAPQRRRIQQQVQQPQRTPQVRFAVPSENSDEEEDEEEDETQPARITPSAKTSSVLQLKQRLADAERNSRAAQAARQQAEQAQLRRRTQRTVGAHRKELDPDEANDDDEEEEDDGFYTQDQWRNQQRQREVQEDSEDEEDEDEEEEGDEDERYRYDRRRYARKDLEGDDGSEVEDGETNLPEEEEEEEEELVHEDGGQSRSSATDENAAASRIARQYRDHQLRARSREQEEEDQRRRRKASQVIAHSLRRNAQRSREKQQQQQRQSEAALAIQRWLVRASSAKASARLHDDSSNTANEAASRIQHWVRRRQAYLKWLEHVEAERDEMIRRRDAKRRREEQQRQREKEEQEEENRRERERRYSEEQERRRQEQLEGEERARRLLEAEQRRQRESAAPEAAKKEKKRVMKREAVDLVKALVTQQLDAKLRDHDDQMMELQRMVARLQDVIRQQSEMLQQTTDEMLEQQHHAPHVKHRQLKPSASNVSLDKHAHSSGTSLPPLQQQQRPPLPPGSTPTSGTRPSGIKPPRQFERTTKLPLLQPSPSSTTATAPTHALKR